MAKNKKFPAPCKELVKKNIVKRVWIFGFLFAISVPFVVVMLVNYKEIPELIVPFIVCMGIFVVSLIFLIHSIKAMKNPEKSYLGKCVIAHSDGGQVADIFELFEKVDEDISKNGKQYADFVIGNEWILGPKGIGNYSAARLDRIEGIFYHHLIIDRGGDKSEEYGVHVVDDKNKDILFNFKTLNGMTEGYEALCALKPDAANGSHDDLAEFCTKKKKKK